MAVYPDPAALAELGTMIAHRRQNDVLSSSVEYDELTLTVNASGITGLIEFLRSEPTCRFSTLVDITAIDHPNRAARFDVVWQLLSMYTNQRIRIKAAVREEDLVPSITRIYPAADWFEREVFDMFGIDFVGHPDMTRILMPEDWDGHPLRKDYAVGQIPVQFKHVGAR